MKQIILISLSSIFSLLISAQPVNDFLDFDTTIATPVTLNHQNRNYNRHTTATNNNFIRHQNDERRSNQISNFVFQSELRKIKNQSNSYIKKLCSKRLLDSYQLNARQITMLCNSLRGYAKLDVAQYAYTRCQDLNNYDLVLNSLSYDMRDELNDYINYINEQYRNSDEDEDDTYGSYNNCYGTMSKEMFGSAIQTIENASFENTKLETAKSIISSNKVTTDQVIEICRLFSFESTKLSFAQFAYNFTADKHNYFKVNNVFDFDASRLKLNQIINH